MADDALRAAFDELRGRLIEAGHLIPCGVDGVYGKSAEYERVWAGVGAAASRLAAPDGPVLCSFPPLLPRVTFDKVEYVRNFPHLSGPMFSFRGDDRAHAELIRRLDEGQPYADLLQQTDVAFTPACCYPVYSTLTKAVPPGGIVFEHHSYCFRHEPSPDPMRMQAFRMWENVRVATPDDVLDWRSTWLSRFAELFDRLGLDARTDIASDPFFGRAGRLMAQGQRAYQLKIEFLVPVFGESEPTACASVNYHLSHFGELFDIRTADGDAAHSACAAVGSDRCVVALFQRYGMETDTWPSSVRAVLWP